MQQTANHLLEIIEKSLPILEKISKDEAQFKASDSKWSKSDNVLS